MIKSKPQYWASTSVTGKQIHEHGHYVGPEHNVIDPLTGHRKALALDFERLEPLGMYYERNGRKLLRGDLRGHVHDETGAFIGHEVTWIDLETEEEFEGILDVMSTGLVGPLYREKS